MCIGVVVDSLVVAVELQIVAGALVEALAVQAEESLWLWILWLLWRLWLLWHLFLALWLLVNQRLDFFPLFFNV